MSPIELLTRLSKGLRVLGLALVCCGRTLPEGPGAPQPYADPTHTTRRSPTVKAASPSSPEPRSATLDAVIDSVESCPAPTYGSTSGGWISNAARGVCCGYSERARLDAPGFEKSGLSQCLDSLAPGLEKRVCLTELTAQGGRAQEPPASIAQSELAQFAFEEGRAELTTLARAELDRVHAAYVKGTCGWAMIAAYTAPSELRRKAPKSLARQRAAAIQSYLLTAGVPEKNARDFGHDDFLDTATRARVSRTKAWGIAFCSGPGATRLPVNGQCHDACDEECTSGATLRAQVPEPGARQLSVQVCLRDACSTSHIDLASLAAGATSALIMRMRGQLPAAVHVLYEPGFHLPELAWGERVRGFFIEVRAGIGMPHLADGDPYTMRLTVDGRERPDLSLTRQALYRDWVPCLNPTHACKDASFPARWHWPWGSLTPLETGF